MFGQTLSPENAYRQGGLEAEALGTTPHGLVKMLFDGALMSINTAKVRLVSGDIAGRCEAVQKALDIINLGLRVSLDLEHGGQLAQNLEDLYQYISLQLIKGNMHVDIKRFEEGYQLLSEVAQAWAQIDQRVKEEIA